MFINRSEHSFHAISDKLDEMEKVALFFLIAAALCRADRIQGTATAQPNTVILDDRKPGADFNILPPSKRPKKAESAAAPFSPTPAADQRQNSASDEELWVAGAFILVSAACMLTVLFVQGRGRRHRRRRSAVL